MKNAIILAAALLLAGCEARDAQPGWDDPLVFRTDPATGCQYVSVRGDGGVYPRMDRGGRQVCVEPRRP